MRLMLLVLLLMTRMSRGRGTGKVRRAAKSRRRAQLENRVLLILSYVDDVGSRTLLLMAAAKLVVEDG